MPSHGGWEEEGERVNYLLGKRGGPIDHRPNLR